MAIGDQENDIAMIEYADMGVAMDNAIPSVKEVANFVTKSNLEDALPGRLNNMFCPDSLRPDRRRPIIPLMNSMPCNKDVVENSFLFQKINPHRNPSRQATVAIFSLLLSIRRRFSPE
ncbi:sugar phosphate phosphatase [Salmonella bongori]|nr:sugar phosphate phosphatase [Salmonella bongori]